MILIITLALILSTFYLTGVVLNLFNIWEFKVIINSDGLFLSWKYYVFFGNGFHKFDRYKQLLKFQEPFKPF